MFLKESPKFHEKKKNKNNKKKKQNERKISIVIEARKAGKLRAKG